MPTIQQIPTDQLKPNPDNPYEDHPDPHLDKDIQEHGIRKPIIIKSDHTIMDGERRWRRACKFGLEQVPCEIREFDGVPDELAIVRLNLYRKKSPREIFKEAQIFRKHEEPKARERQGTRTDIRPNLDKSKHGRVLDKVAEHVGVSRGQVHKIEAIYDREKEHPDVAEKVDRGEMSVHAGYKAVTQDKTLESEEEFAVRFTQRFQNHIKQLWTHDFPTIINHMNTEHNCRECHMHKACTSLLENLVQMQNQLPTCMTTKLA